MTRHGLHPRPEGRGARQCRDIEDVAELVGLASLHGPEEEAAEGTETA
ncbi:hypothetical protein [Thermoactinospora rubra]|nr:hypothetical protein [Thermoactinospora rubra]